jgi:hypothetical protein
MKRPFWATRGLRLARLFLICLIFVPVVLSAGQNPIGTVSYQDGKLSLAFDGTLTETALAAILEKTGHEIILPANVEARSVTVQTGPRSLDDALRRFLHALGLENFALVYQGNGESRQVIVLGPRAQYPAHGFSIPQYIPQTSEPVYVPPVDGSRSIPTTLSTQSASLDE